MGRIGRFIAQANPGADDAELLARDKLAHALMYLARGMPVVYYGDEQGFTGDGGDKDARQDMLPSQVAAYNDDDLIGTTATTADANFDADAPAVQRSSATSPTLQGRPPGAAQRRPGPALLDERGRHLRVLAHRPPTRGSSTSSRSTTPRPRRPQTIPTYSADAGVQRRSSRPALGA